jgi:site-specific DNA-cytosine methylase
LDFADAIAAATGHPALRACVDVARVFTDHAQRRPGAPEREWALDAQQYVLAVADLLAEAGPADEIQAVADKARGDLAALTLGLLDEAGPMTPHRLAGLTTEMRELLTWYAAPWPLEWLWAPMADTFDAGPRERVVQLFHGPGGWSVGFRDILDADVDMVGVDLDAGAVATATAAGFRVIHADVTDLDPEHPGLQHVTGAVLSPPCQPFAPSGLRRGRAQAAIEQIVYAIHLAGAAAGFFRMDDLSDPDTTPVYAPPTGDTWDEVREAIAELDDPRAGLMAEVAIWPLAMLARDGSLEWVAVEQSSALPAEIEHALADQFRQALWHTVEAETLDAADYGAASHRKRRFLTFYRHRAPYIPVRPATPFPVTTFAQVAGWPAGRTVSTRGVRGTDPVTGRPKGGGNFSADKTSICVTATAYGWTDTATGQRITQDDISRLVGFRPEHPWRHVGRGRGVRHIAQQTADAVCPMVAAAVGGRVMNRAWEARARAWVEGVYRPNPCSLLT